MLSMICAEDASLDSCGPLGVTSGWHVGYCTTNVSGHRYKWLTRQRLLSSEMRRKSRLWSRWADPITDLRQLHLSNRWTMLRWDDLIYLTLFKVGRVVSFHSICPVDAHGGLWNHNSVIGSLCLRINFLSSTIYWSSAHSLHFSASAFFPLLKLHPHVRTIYVALALRWEVQMILCREETNAVFLGLLNFPSD